MMNLERSRNVRIISRDAEGTEVGRPCGVDVPETLSVEGTRSHDN
jgi:hypothetical protein